MNGLNKVMLIGNVGKDPQVQTRGQLKIATLSIATSEKYKDKTGQLKTETEWHYITCFNKLADVVGSYVKKGSAIYVEGKLKTEKFADANGNEKQVTKIIAMSVQILNSKKEQKPTEFHDDEDLDF